MEGNIEDLDENVVVTNCEEYMCEGFTEAAEQDLRVHRTVVFQLEPDQ